MSLCRCIGDFSAQVNYYLTRTFSLHLNFSEIGMTDHLVICIVDYLKSKNSREAEIYKLPWNVETVYGNDLDLFVKNRNGRYNWYTLQAKTMSYDGYYKELKHIPNRILQQWEKLLLHETRFGSKSFYLFYNGLLQSNVQPVRADCIGVPSILEMGLGIVETVTIQNIRSVIPNNQIFDYQLVYPSEMDAFRKLFCCAGKLKPNKTDFAYDQISTKGYLTIYSNKDKSAGPGETIYPTENFLENGRAPIRIIINTDGE